MLWVKQKNQRETVAVRLDLVEAMKSGYKALVGDKWKGVVVVYTVGGRVYEFVVDEERESWIEALEDADRLLSELVQMSLTEKTMEVIVR